MAHRSNSPTACAAFIQMGEFHPIGVYESDFFSCFWNTYLIKFMITRQLRAMNRLNRSFSVPKCTLEWRKYAIMHLIVTINTYSRPRSWQVVEVKYHRVYMRLYACVQRQHTWAPIMSERDLHTTRTEKWHFTSAIFNRLLFSGTVGSYPSARNVNESTSIVAWLSQNSNTAEMVHNIFR